MILVDTSAIVGWLERGNPFVNDWIRAHDEVPRCHPVSIGELHAGTWAADAVSDAGVLTRRSQTLDFVVERLDLTLAATPEQCRVFGVLAAHTSRKLSHNDMWIVAEAIVSGHELITEDQRQFDVAALSTQGALREALTSAGYQPLHSRLASAP